MKVRLSAFAIALVLVVNAAVLAGVVWNRSVEPAAVLELTERELALPYGRWAGRESTGVALSIRRAAQDHEWLDRDKLAELGFDIGRYERQPRSGWRPAQRRVHVVLEYDGPAFDELLAEHEARLESSRQDLETGKINRRQVEAAEAALERLRVAESRLIVVDAARAPEVLRERYPDRRRYAIVQALVRMHAVSRPDDTEQPQLRGRVDALLPGRVYVPRRFHSPLREASDERRNAYDAPPRYRVVLNFGRRAEPWVAGVEPIPGGEGSEAPSG